MRPGMTCQEYDRIFVSLVSFFSNRGVFSSASCGLSTFLSLLEGTVLSLNSVASFSPGDVSSRVVGLSPDWATAKPIWLKELDRVGAGLEDGETRADIILREFIFRSTCKP